MENGRVKDPGTGRGWNARSLFSLKAISPRSTQTKAEPAGRVEPGCREADNRAGHGGC